MIEGETLIGRKNKNPKQAIERRDLYRGLDSLREIRKCKNE
jgi:hypothetical protein